MVKQLFGSALLGLLIVVGISYTAPKEHDHADGSHSHGERHEVKKSPGPSILDHTSHGHSAHEGHSKKGHGAVEMKEGLKHMHEDHTGAGHDHDHDHEEGHEGHSH